MFFPQISLNLISIFGIIERVEDTLNSSCWVKLLKLPSMGSGKKFNFESDFSVCQLTVISSKTLGKSKSIVVGKVTSYASRVVSISVVLYSLTSLSTSLSPSSSKYSSVL